MIFRERFLDDDEPWHEQRFGDELKSSKDLGVFGLIIEEGSPFSCSVNGDMCFYPIKGNSNGRLIQYRILLLLLLLLLLLKILFL